MKFNDFGKDLADITKRRPLLLIAAVIAIVALLINVLGVVSLTPTTKVAEDKPVYEQEVDEQYGDIVQTNDDSALSKNDALIKEARAILSGNIWIDKDGNLAVFSDVLFRQYSPDVKPLDVGHACFADTVAPKDAQTDVDAYTLTGSFDGEHMSLSLCYDKQQMLWTVDIITNIRGYQLRQTG